MKLRNLFCAVLAVLLFLLTGCSAPVADSLSSGGSADSSGGLFPEVSTDSTDVQSDLSAEVDSGTVVDTETSSQPSVDSSSDTSVKPSTDSSVVSSADTSTDTTVESSTTSKKPPSLTNTVSDSSSDVSTENTETPEKKKFTVLFIGNSYTYYNDMPTVIFKNFAKIAGYTLDVTAITKGSHTLAKFADPKDEYGKKVEAALTGTKKYDYVIIQEQSSLPATDDVASFYAAVRNLAQRIRATGAQPILYSTWGRKTGHKVLAENGWTNETMTWKLAAAYEAIGKELNIPVAYVGLAFYDVYTGGSNIELYNEDKTHPSYEGSYLAAATLFAKIFDVDPTTVKYDGSVLAINAKALRQAAKDAVFATPTIPSKYQTSSVGKG